MSTDLYVALSGAIARLRELDLVANNLANANTIGFKRDRSAFVTALESAVQGIDGAPTPGAAASVFAAADTNGLDLSAGSVEHTGSPLDVAIKGEGFFVVQAPEGTRYTRAGSFVVNAAGLLSTPSGLPVLGDGGPISVDSGAVQILESGRVVDTEQNEVGRLQVVRFSDAGKLSKQGQNLLQASQGAGPSPVEDPHLVERSVESSNVQPVQELADLVALQRAFGMVMRMLQLDDETMEELIQEVSS